MNSSSTLRTDPLHVFIMAGGTGERFWPLSRISKPKHLLRLLGEKTLLEEAIERASAVVPASSVHVLTNESQVRPCIEAAGHLIPVENFITEPAKRDTAPAAALATALARSKDSNALCALLPADAMIHDSETFARQLRDAAVAASRSDAAGMLFTFSIAPTFASTAFGYLELGGDVARVEGGSSIHKVIRFVEKPDPDTAEEYVSAGSYGWNAGMFLWKTESFLGECSRQIPALAEFIAGFPKGDPGPYIAKKFPHLPKISVDYAIMENAASVRAIRSQFDWDDVGSWTALPAHLESDDQHNTRQGPSAVLDSHNNIVVSTGRTIALCGVSDLVVVETPDAVLVCHRNNAQRVKNLQPLLPVELR